MPLFAVALSIAVPAATAQPVSVPHFDSVELNGGGALTIVPGPVQRVTMIEGSTRFTSVHVRKRGKLEIRTHCDERCPRNYILRVRVESPRVPDVAISAGGMIVVGRGFAPQRQLAASVSAGGTIDLRRAAADDVSAAINAGGNIYVGPTRILSAAVSAGGSIHYLGRPMVSTAIQNGGDVRRDD